MDTWLKTGIGGIIGMVGGAGLQYALTQPVYSCVPPDPSEYDEECNGTGICPNCGSPLNCEVGTSCPLCTCYNCGYICWTGWVEPISTLPLAGAFVGGLIGAIIGYKM